MARTLEDVYRDPRLVAYGQFVFRYRNTLFPVVLLILVLVFRPNVAFGSPVLDAITDLVGVLVILAGLALRALVIGLDYIKRGGQDGRVYAEHLVTGGIFAHSRNPLYVGNILILVGLLIVCNDPWVYVIGLLLTLSAYMGIVAAEENFLRRKFGAEYENYCRRVNRWLPRPNGLWGTLRAGEFHWARVVVKDYNTMFIWIVAALAMIVYERAVRVGYDLGPASAALLAFVFGLAVAGYAGVRFLKKRRILTQNGWSTPA